jgi:hypothetical protein
MSYATAGIVPPVIVTDVEPKLAVHRSNNQNRDATPGQKAMATAMAFPDPARLKRKGMFPEETSDAGFNKATLSKARYVLRNCRDCFHGVNNYRRPSSISSANRRIASALKVACSRSNAGVWRAMCCRLTAFRCRTCWRSVRNWVDRFGRLIGRLPQV